MLSELFEPKTIRHSLFTEKLFYPVWVHTTESNLSDMYDIIRNSATFTFQNTRHQMLLNLVKYYLPLLTPECCVQTTLQSSLKARKGHSEQFRRMSLTPAVSSFGSLLHKTSVHNYCVFLTYFTNWTSVKIYAQSMKLCVYRMVTHFAQNLWICLASIPGLIFSNWLRCIGDIDGGNLWDV